MSHSDIDEIDQTNDFGSVLAAARKAQNLTVNDVSEHIKIPGAVLTALEESDLSALPAPTFTQGYLRTYAKFLSVSDDALLAAYNRAVPHDQATELKPRSTLPNETNSESPIVRMVTFALLFAGITAAIYGSYQYYQEKADIMGDELETRDKVFTGNSLDSPGTQRITIKQNARLTENGELQPGELQQGEGEDVANSAVDAVSRSEKRVDRKGLSPSLNPAVGAVSENQADEIIVAADALSRKPGKIKKPAPAVDELEIIAQEDAWLDVRDASSTRLFYNILGKGRSKLLKGRAPFNVSLGNARTTRVLINNIEIDTKRYLRKNNTAKFIVSSKKDKVIFH